MSLCLPFLRLEHLQFIHFVIFLGPTLPDFLFFTPFSDSFLFSGCLLIQQRRFNSFVETCWLVAVELTAVVSFDFKAAPRLVLAPSFTPPCVTVLVLLPLFPLICGFLTSRPIAPILL